VADCSAIILVTCLLSFVISSTSHYTTSLIGSILAPFCAFPLLSMASMCSGVHRPIKNTSRRQEPRFDQLVTIQMSFDSIMNNIGLSAYLGMGMKRSEAAVRDLSIQVGFLSTQG
jgi:hypothetical protein